MNKVYKTISALAGSSLLLTGCAGIYEFGTPLGECDGGPIAISVNDEKPVVRGSSSDTPFELTVTGDLAKVTVEYRSGVYGNDGLTSINNLFLGPTSAPDDGDPNTQDPVVTPEPVPTVSAPGFLDFFDYTGPDASVKDTGPKFDLLNSSFSSNGNVHTINSTLASILENSTQRLEGGLGEAEILFSLMPGAFLAKCTTTGKFVAAAPVFPNLVTLDVDPSLTVVSGNDGTDGNPVTPQTITFDMPTDYAGYQAGLLGVPRFSPTPLSSNAATDRWLQLFSFDPFEPEDGEPIEFIGGLDEQGNMSQTGDIVGSFIFNKPYSLILFLFKEIGNPDGTDLNSPTLLDFKTVIFDVKIDPVTGGATFEEFTGIFVPPVFEDDNTDPTDPPIDPTDPPIDPPTRKPAKSNAPQLGSLTSEIAISSKGNRVVKLTGTNMRRVNSIAVGNRTLSIRNSDYFTLEARFPKLAPGKYNLVLGYSGGKVVKEQFVRYYQSTTIDTLKVLSASTRSSWASRVRNFVSSSNVVQVDCVARVPAGISPVAIKKKARTICSSIANSNILTSVSVKPIKATKKASVLLKLWD